MVGVRGVGTTATSAVDDNIRAVAGGRDQAAGSDDNPVAIVRSAIRATSNARDGDQAAGRTDFGSDVACGQCIDHHTVIITPAARAQPAAGTIDRDGCGARG